MARIVNILEHEECVCFRSAYSRTSEKDISNVLKHFSSNKAIKCKRENRIELTVHQRYNSILYVFFFEIARYAFESLIGVKFTFEK